jgi:hypothetical protein
MRHMTTMTTTAKRINKELVVIAKGHLSYIYRTYIMHTVKSPRTALSQIEQRKE